MTVLNEVIQEAANDEKNKAGVNGRLMSFVDRMENLHTEIDNLKIDLKEIKSEAKSDGYDTRIINLVLRIRRMDPDKRAEQESLLETYLSNIGMS